MIDCMNDEQDSSEDERSFFFILLLLLLLLVCIPLGRLGVLIFHLTVRQFGRLRRLGISNEFKEEEGQPV